MLNSKRLEKIRREIKRPFKDYTNTTNKIKALQACKSEIDAFWGESNEINKGIETVLRFYRWSAILGRSLARFVGVPDPFPNPKHPCNNFWLFARQVGIDLKKEIHATDGALILDGIKIPLPRNKSEKMMLEYELHDILFPSYLKRKYESFDRYCETIGGLLNDFPEGPYEFGKVCLKEGNIVFDCGANVGVFSAVASRYGCQSFAFEAIPDIIDDYLSKTATMNGNIHVHNVAVWDKEEILNFAIMQDISASRCGQLLDQVDCKKINEQVAVPAITLDAFVEKHGIERVDFIKADIEGAERNMLRGAKRILKEFAPKLSICTYHLPDDPQVLREIILEANPKYQIVEKFSKMYAHVP